MAMSVVVSHGFRFNHLMIQNYHHHVRNGIAKGSYVAGLACYLLFYGSDDNGSYVFLLASKLPIDQEGGGKGYQQ